MRERLGQVGRHGERADPDEPARRDGEHGQCQHAPGLIGEHARGERMGSHPSLRGLPGLESKSGKRDTARHGLPPMQHLRKEEMPAWRLCLPQQPLARHHRLPGELHPAGEKITSLFIYPLKPKRL